MAGLRDTKKARTRRTISDVATAMFIARGFDAVTVAEVADAAEVSKMTVFNHFPRKEDLLLDRQPEAEALLREVIGTRPPGTTPLAALRAAAVDLAEQRHALSGVRDGTAGFQRTLHASPALLARLREIGAEIETVLADLLARAGEPHPELLAALVVAAYRTVVGPTVARILAGESADDVADDHVTALHAAFDALDAAAATLSPRKEHAGVGRPAAPDAAPDGVVGDGGRTSVVGPARGAGEVTHGRGIEAPSPPGRRAQR